MIVHKVEKGCGCSICTVGSVLFGCGESYEELQRGLAFVTNLHFLACDLNTERKDEAALFHIEYGKRCMNYALGLAGVPDVEDRDLNEQKDEATCWHLYGALRTLEENKELVFNCETTDRIWSATRMFFSSLITRNAKAAETLKGFLDNARPLDKRKLH